MRVFHEEVEPLFHVDFIIGRQNSRASSCISQYTVIAMLLWMWLLGHANWWYDIALCSTLLLLRRLLPVVTLHICMTRHGSLNCSAYCTQYGIAQHIALTAVIVTCVWPCVCRSGLRNKSYSNGPLCTCLCDNNNNKQIVYTMWHSTTSEGE